MPSLIWQVFRGIHWRDVLDIILVSYVLYRVFVFLRGTRAEQVARGLVILIVASFVSRWARLTTVDWILRNFWAVWLMVIIIIFQPELRRALAQLGQSRFLGALLKSEERVVKEIVESVGILAKKRIGALIVLERESSVREFIEAGTRIDSEVSAELLNAIFMPNSPLHDGAVIIRERRVAYAGCFLPLSQNSRLSKKLGTRHRAAIGLSEETDALVIVVSEETGEISLAMTGNLIPNLTLEKVEELLSRYRPSTRRESSLFSLKKH